MEFLRRLYNDLLVLQSIWFANVDGNTHKERLDSFYGPQAHAYDQFRARFLHGRRPLLQACAVQVKQMGDRAGLVWVDLGGGTGENIDMMNDYMDISRFEKIYMVDLCGPLCEVARRKAEAKGWTNVEVVEGDVCDFVPAEGTAQLVTFSYSLSMIPPFMEAVDQAASYLDPSNGILGITDFTTSNKYDKPGRQHGYLTRWFWRAVFDIDGINLGPERRTYLEYQLQTVTELNGRGGIPYVPFLKPPYYVSLFRRRPSK